MEKTFQSAVINILKNCQRQQGDSEEDYMGKLVLDIREDASGVGKQSAQAECARAQHYSDTSIPENDQFFLSPLALAAPAARREVSPRTGYSTGQSGRLRKQ